MKNLIRKILKEELNVDLSRAKKIDTLNSIDWTGYGGVIDSFDVLLYHGASNMLGEITLDNLILTRKPIQLKDSGRYGSSKSGCMGFYLTPSKGDLFNPGKRIYPRSAAKYAFEKAYKNADYVGRANSKAMIYEVIIDPNAIIVDYYPGGCLGKAFSKGQQDAEQIMLDNADGFYGAGEIAITNKNVIKSIKLIESASVENILSEEKWKS